MNALNNIKLGTKLIGGFLIVAVLLVGVAILGFTTMDTMQKGQEELYHDRLIPIAQLGAIDTASEKVRGDLHRFILMSNQRTPMEQSIVAQFDLIDKEAAKFRATSLMQEEKDELVKFDAALASYRRAIEDDLRDVKAGDEKTALESISAGGATLTSRTALEQATDKLVEINVKQAQVLDEEFGATSVQSRIVFVVVTIVGLLVAIGLGIVLSRSITAPLGKSVTMLQEMAKGHLGSRLKMGRRDEIGSMAGAMDQFADDLQNVVIGTMKKIAGGDLSTEVAAKDAQDEIAPALKGTIESLRGLVAETQVLTKASVDGKLATRGNADKFQGGYREIVAGINATLDAVVGPLNVSAEYVDRISKGDIPAKITGCH